MTTIFENPILLQQSIIVVGSADFRGAVSFPAAVIADSNIIDSADIEASKLEHRHSINYVQDGGTDIIAATKIIHLCRAAGIIKSIKVRPFTAPNGGDKQFTVDVKKAVDGSSVFSTVLSAVIIVDDSSVDHTIQNGVLIGDPSILVGDAIQIVISISGTTGNQGQGIIVNINIDESGI